MNEVSYKKKREIVEANQNTGTTHSDYGYVMEVPPVPTILWDTNDWVSWIDKTGYFYTKVIVED